MVKKILYTVCVCLFAVMIFLGGGDTLNAGVRGGFELWFKSVLGTLFVCSLLGAALEHSGLAVRLGALLAPLTRPFGAGSAGAYAAVLAAVSGFPLGVSALAAVLRSESRPVTDGECALASCPGLTFSVFTVGKLLGLAPAEALPLWLCPLGAALLIGAVGRGAPDGAGSEASLDPDAGTRGVFLTLKELPLRLTYVGSCIALFSLIAAWAGPVLNMIAPADKIVHLLLEIAGGCASLPTGSLCAAAGGLGFSGLCVVAQSLPSVRACGMSARRFLTIKTIQGVLSYTLCTVYSVTGPLAAVLYAAVLAGIISFRRVWRGRNADLPDSRRYSSRCRQ